MPSTLFLFTDNGRGWCDSGGLNCYTLIIRGFMNVCFYFKSRFRSNYVQKDDLFQLSIFMFLTFVQQVNLILQEFSLFVFGSVNFNSRGYSTHIPRES